MAGSGYKMHTAYFREERLRKKRPPLYHIPCEHWPVLLIIISVYRAKLCIREGKVSLAVIEKKSVLCHWFFHSLCCTMVTLSQNQHSQSVQKKNPMKFLEPSTFWSLSQSYRGTTTLLFSEIYGQYVIDSPAEIFSSTCWPCLGDLSHWAQQASTN